MTYKAYRTRETEALLRNINARIFKLYSAGLKFTSVQNV